MTFITKKCFPPAKICYNCNRKNRSGVKENEEKNKDFARCSGCHFLTYCDSDCQREHWRKVHKNHCKFLGGKKNVDNHPPQTSNTANCLAKASCKTKSCHCCPLCIEEKSADATQLGSIKSPKTKCHIGDMINLLKTALGLKFDFHAEGRSCSCESEIPLAKECGIEGLDYFLNIPFPLGEVSGKYVHANEEIVAHALRITNAISFKDKNIAKNKTFKLLDYGLINFRVSVWIDVLTHGVFKGIAGGKPLCDYVNSLKPVYGPRNAWWKALAATVDNIGDMNFTLDSVFIDYDSLKGERFKDFKLNLDYDLSQQRNCEFASKNNLLSNFKFWPTVAGKSLVLTLPEGVKCHSCGKAQAGEVRVSSEETDKTLSRLHPGFGADGNLLVLCPNNDFCTAMMMHKNLRFQKQLIPASMKPYKEQRRMFLTESRDCDFCLRQSLSSHRCSGCLAAQYCSTSCQKKDKDFHATVCSVWAKDPYRKIMGAKKQKKMHKEFLDKYYDEVFK